MIPSQSSSWVGVARGGELELKKIKKHVLVLIHIFHNTKHHKKGKCFKLTYNLCLVESLDLSLATVSTW